MKKLGLGDIVKDPNDVIPPDPDYTYVPPRHPWLAVITVVVIVGGVALICAKLLGWIS